MKKILFAAVLIGASFVSSAQLAPATTAVVAAPAERSMVVDASCAECKFGIEGKGCVLAVQIDGKPYLVEGAKMDNYGDAHAKDGMCNAIRKAEVQGKIDGDKFVATSFKLLPMKKD